MAKTPKLSTGKTPILPPALFVIASQKSAGKTHLAVFLADFLSLYGHRFQAFQVDDQKRLAQMIGDMVVDLRVDPQLLIDDPTLAMRAFTPFYEAAQRAKTDCASILFDIGANQVETVRQFSFEADLAEDCQSWGLPIVLMVPYLPADPESNEQADYTIRLLREPFPDARLILIENRFGGRADRIVQGSLAEKAHRRLLATAGDCDHVAMPAIPRDYWAPYEGAGVRFIKALAMNPTEGSEFLGRPVPEIKIMRSAVARFWRSMDDVFSTLIDIKKGGDQ